MNYRRQSEAALRFEERSRRENEARRLHDLVPRLEALRIELEEYRHDGTSPLVRHTRHIVVERAPALFVIVCGDQSCVDGGHELTREFLRELASSSMKFAGEHECQGRRNGENCRHKLRYTAQAKYATA